ncbi:hypothetical protein FGLOB1_12832 [Fusarium globosum]|uniref:Uncharacterized protein n=1 Tax=Fusarium globosum TaxID=78864 RepID=A0A8H5XPY4_9HYPO|nr:hypothetical protein FGLOB1_12832 [Fusarium globosum]
MDPEEFALSIKNETVDIHNIGVDVCRNSPLPPIPPAKMHRLCQAITADIFYSAGVQRHEARECFDAMAGRIHKDRLFEDVSLEHYGGINFLKQTLSQCRLFQERTKKHVCIPANAMGSILAAVAYRKLRPSSEAFLRNNQDFVKLFGELNLIQWLPIAIRMWARIKGNLFAIELNERSYKPVVALQKVGGRRLRVVATKMPQMNRFEDIFRKTFSPADSKPGPVVPKLEPDDNVLPSVEPNDISNEPISISDDDEMEENTITLREYTRQMKTLAKRLTTPDRAIARCARREILKKPEEVGEQQVDEIGPPKEFFDSYTHLKDVWKTCLQNQVSIPNSLRVLVDHHCTPSQVFHLTELEKEHLAEVGMEVDG